MKRLDREQLYSPVEAVDLVKSLATAKFDETIELAVRLGVDPRRADQIVRGSLVAARRAPAQVCGSPCSPPASTPPQARAAGADVVGADDLDRPDRERGLPRLRRRDRDARPHGAGRAARPGPRTARPDAEPEDRDGDDRRRQGGRRVPLRAGRVPHRPRRQHPRARSARRPSSRRQLLENIRAVLDELQRAKPAAAKGKYIRSVTLSSTMGPGVRIDPSRIRITDEELAAIA